MNAANRWFIRGGALLCRDRPQETILFGMALLLTTWIAASVPLSLFALLPAVAVTCGWATLGGRARRLWVDARRLRLPGTRWLPLHALLLQLALSVLLPALLLKLLGALLAVSMVLLLAAAALGLLLANLSAGIGGVLCSTIYLGAALWCSRHDPSGLLADTTPLPWESLLAGLLLVLATLACWHNVRAGDSPAQHAGMAAGGPFCSMLESGHDRWQTRSHAAPAPIRTPRHRLALTLGPPLAMPSRRWWLGQVVLVALLAGFVAELGPEHNVHIATSLSRAGFLLLLLPGLGVQCAHLLHQRRPGTSSTLALLPGLGASMQRGRRMCASLLRSFLPYALLVLLPVLAIGMYTQMPWTWLAWASGWAALLVALDVLACVAALTCVEWLWAALIVPTCVIGGLAALALAAPQPSTGWIVCWCACLALVALAALGVCWRWRAPPSSRHRVV
jgi:hypothetical protein